ncbi:MAG: hypothetical protein ABJN52_15620 [Litorimonas sp.]
MASGIIDSIFPDYQDYYFLPHALLVGFLLYLWCGKHAEENSITPHTGSQVLCALIGIVGVPFYLFSTFGFKLGGKKVILGIAFLLGIYLGYEIAFYATKILMYWI